MTRHCKTARITDILPGAAPFNPSQPASIPLPVFLRSSQRRHRSSVGAWVLLWLTGLGVLFDYTLFGRPFDATPVKLVVGVLLLVIALMEVLPRFRNMEFDARYLPLGEAMSGFFGDLSGM